MSSNLKRKQTEKPTCCSKSARSIQQNRPSSPSYSQKCHCSCSTPIIPPPIVDTCQNYLKSGVPVTVMFYKRNEWVPFPETALKVLINGVRNDRSSTVVFIDGHTLMVDFLSMTAVNMKTGKVRSISWIDESGKCFFPPLFLDQNVDGDEDIHDVSKTQNRDNIGNAPSLSEMLRKKIKLLENGTQLYNWVKSNFLYGMGPFGETGTGTVLLHVHRYEPDDDVAKARLEAFEKNGVGFVTRYGWFGCGKKDMARVLIHGFGKGLKTLNSSSSNGGMNIFMPASRAFACVNQCDVDEKGMQYMLLCRVLPNIPNEVGIIKPKFYSISSNSSDFFVQPEYLVSFKLSPVIREYLMGLNREIWLDVPSSVVPTCHQVRFELDKEAGPTSPWMSFSGLYGAIHSNLSPIVKELIFHHYDELKKKKITREELVKKIRIIVGDKILRNTLFKHQRCPSSWHEEPILNAKQIDGTTTSGICDSSGALRPVPICVSNYASVSDSLSGSSRAISAKKCVDNVAIVGGASDSAPSTSQPNNWKMAYYSIEQGMQANNEAIDSILRAAKLDSAGP